MNRFYNLKARIHTFCNSNTKFYTPHPVVKFKGVYFPHVTAIKRITSISKPPLNFKHVCQLIFERIGHVHPILHCPLGIDT